MRGYIKIKNFLMIVLIFLLSGCGTIKQDSVGSDSNQITEDAKVSNEVKPTESVNDVTEGTDEINLQKAISLIQDKKYPQAIGLLSKISDNKQAKDLLEQLRYIISGTYIANLNAGVAAIDKNGKVIIIIDDSLYQYYQYKEVPDWDDIKSLSFAQGRLDALDKEGFIHSTRDTDPNYVYVADMLKSYTDLEIISTDFDNFVLLSKNENVYSYSAKNGEVLREYEGDISSWRNIVDVITGQLRIALLNRDGKVFVADYNKYIEGAIGNLYDEISDWTDIVDISAASDGPIAGLKTDGTVVISKSYTTSKTNLNDYDVSSWKDIIAISKSNNTLLGLKRDGTVVATGNNDQKQLDVSDWKNIVAIASGDWISIGLRSDGTLVIAGKTESGVITPDISGVGNLFVPTVQY